VPERQDCIWLDLLVTSTQIAPTIAISWFGAAGLCLYVEGYDLRIYSAVQPVQDPAQYEGHKHALLGYAEAAVQAAWRQVQPIIPYELRTTDPVHGFVWDANANGRWIAALSLAQPRLTQAFSSAGPGDLGRPALLPAGLQLAADGTVLASLTTPYLHPSLQICQPWMVAFGALVAGTDFWPTLTRACLTQAEAIFLVPTFTYTILNPTAGVPSVVNLTSMDTDTGTPVFDPFTAYNLPNVGPGGGANAQTVTLTVYTANLTAGVTYTLTLTTSVLQVASNTTTTVTTTSTFLATGSDNSTQLAPLVAASNTVAKVLSVSLS
jgi:hypothetical protein